MVDIKRMSRAAEGRFKDRILASGFHDNESASDFIESMGQCFREILEQTIRDAIDEDRKTPRGNNGSSGGPPALPYNKGKEWYDSSDLFPFGKYGPRTPKNPNAEERSFGEIPSNYFEWLIDQPWIDQWPGIVRYINGEDPPEEKSKEPDSEVPF